MLKHNIFWSILVHKDRNSDDYIILITYNYYKYLKFK